MGSENLEWWHWGFYAGWEVRVRRMACGKRLRIQAWPNARYGECNATAEEYGHCKATDAAFEESELDAVVRRVVGNWALRFPCRKQHAPDA